MKRGVDYIGVAAGAVIINDEGKYFVALRGKEARDESGKWEFPGGGVEFGETLEQAVVREIKEECGVEVEIVDFLSVDTVFIQPEGYHWVAVTYVCKIIEGEPKILEPHKCDQIGWFTLGALANMPLSLVTIKNIETLKTKGYV